jgi:hypothetical protein
MWNSKPKKSDCDCRGRTHGNPKWGNGPCYGYGMRKTVVSRINAKRLERAWLEALRGGSEVDD